LYWVDRRE